MPPLQLSRQRRVCRREYRPMRIKATIVAILVSGINTRIDGTSIRVPPEAIHDPLRETRMPLLVFAEPGLAAGEVR